MVFMFAGAPLRHEEAHSVAGLYDPGSNRWTTTSKAPIRPLGQSVAVWTGSQVVLAGMTAGYPSLQLASYDPTTNRWIRLPPAFPRQHPTQGFAMVETDDGVLLWSLWGRTKKIASNEYEGFSGIDLDRLTPAGRWLQIRRWPLHSQLGTPTFIGSSVLIPAGQTWCGSCTGPASFDTHGYLLNPRTLRIHNIPHGPLDDIGPESVWTGGEEVELNPAGVIGGRENVRPDDTAVWNARTRRWTRGPRAPRQLSDEPGVWSGNQLLILSLNGRLLSFHQ